MSNLAELFTQNVRTHLNARQWTQAHLAEACGMAAPAVSKYLGGKNEPGFEIIERFASALGCKPWELMKPPGDQTTQRMDRSALIGEIIVSLGSLQEDKLLTVLRFIQSLVRALNKTVNVANKKS